MTTSLRLLNVIVIAIQLVSITSGQRSVFCYRCRAACSLSQMGSPDTPHSDLTARWARLTGRMDNGFSSGAAFSGGGGGGGNFGGNIGFRANFGVKAHFGGRVTDDQYHEYSRGTDALNWDKGHEHQTSMFEFSVDPYADIKVNADFHFGSPA